MRPYQVAAVDDLRSAYGRGYRAPILQLATGGGKTLVFAEIVRLAREKGRRVLVLVHKRELVNQASAKLALAGVPHGVIAAGFEPSPGEVVQIASVQTLVRRLDHLGDVDLVVIDEAHHARAATWRAILAAVPGARLLGVTATPARLDGKGLGAGAGGMFDAIISGPSINTLIDAGFLSRVRVFVPRSRLDLTGVRTRAGDYVAGELAARVDRAQIAGNAVDEYRRRADHQPAIAFCITVEHAEHVATAFRGAGYRSAAVHGGLDPRERDRLIAGLGTGEIEVLTACDLISEGLDVPAVGAVILLRPTKSLVLYMQRVGRGMRPAPGKDALTVLDLAANSLEHGLPDRQRRWSLDGVEKVLEPAPVRICPACGAVNPLAAVTCSECGTEFPRAPRSRPVLERDDELHELTAERLAAVRALPYRTIVSGRFSEAELHEYARAHGYKPGWVWHRLREQETA